MRMKRSGVRGGGRIWKDQLLPCASWGRMLALLPSLIPCQVSWCPLPCRYEDCYTYELSHPPASCSRSQKKTSDSVSSWEEQVVEFNHKWKFRTFHDSVTWMTTLTLPKGLIRKVKENTKNCIWKGYVREWASGAYNTYTGTNVS
jgi:hypothetical protein